MILFENKPKVVCLSDHSMLENEIVTTNLLNFKLAPEFGHKQHIRGATTIFVD